MPHFNLYVLPVPGASNQLGTVSYNTTANLAASSSNSKDGVVAFVTTANVSGDGNIAGSLQGTASYNTSATYTALGDLPNTFFTDLNVFGSVGIRNLLLQQTQTFIHEGKARIRNS